MSREGPTEKVTSEQRLEGGEKAMLGTEWVRPGTHPEELLFWVWG